MSLHKMSREEIEDLSFRAQLDNGRSDELTWACDVDETDHLHIARVGELGSRLRGRVGVKTHGIDDPGTVTFFSAAEARMIAAAILNAADEIDGAVPLVFHPRPATPEAELDIPEGNETERQRALLDAADLIDEAFDDAEEISAFLRELGEESDE